MNACKNIGLGTAAIGRPSYINIKDTFSKTKTFSQSAFKKKGIALLDIAYENGIRYFDTAPGYGIAETLLIDWVKTKNDPSILVGSKWGYTYTANFDPNAIQHEIKEHSLSKLNAQWQVSKQLLPYLRFYQIHSATLATGVLENQEILEELHQLKTVHNLQIGITTSGANQTAILQKALSIKIAGVALFSVFQCTYNPLEQSIYAIAKEISNQNKQLILKEVLANGRVFTNEAYPHYTNFYNYLHALEIKYKVGRDAILMQYAATQFPKAIVLSGAHHNLQLQSNLKALHLSISPDELATLSSFKTAPELYWSERKQLNWN
ncbi:aldo/keto reductase [Tenacibaculum maritimum]|uniref:aldo/keto reductase n=1 Tax=Tenacibaculum maritimum TaxID=107401 RepID=UPI0038760709